MIFSEILSLVWINIFENKVKVLLTSLGIIVGAAPIIMVIAIGKGGQQDVADQFKNLNASAIEISANNSGGANRGSAGAGATNRMMSMPQGRGNIGGMGGRVFPSAGMPSGMMPGGMMPGGMMPMLESTMNVYFTEDSLEELGLFVPDLSSITMSISGKYSIMGGDLEEAASNTVAGVLSNYQKVSNLEVLIGEFFTDEDNTAKNKVCVLGNTLAISMFSNELEAYDSIVNIDGRSYTVIGVLKEMGSMASGISPDNTAYIPYNTSTKYIFGTKAAPQITAVASDVTKVAEIKTNIETVLKKIYPGGSFTITDAGSKMEAASKSANTLSMLLIAVASIVFIVGGIGIMNVLFVSVKERTREIGILKALGCSKTDILLEFLIEAAVIGIFGGVVGVITGIALMPVMARFMTVIPTTQSAVLALTFAVFTSTVFGFYPAFKASQLVPIEALNQE